LIGQVIVVNEQKFEEVHDTFLRALANMKSLRYCTLVTEFLAAHKFQTLWRALSNAKTLDRLEIASPYGSSLKDSVQRAQILESFNKTLFSLRWPSLTSLTLIFYMSDSSELCARSLTTFLLSCICLTELRLFIPQSSASEDLDLSSLFLAARWPSLRRLRLTAIGANADAVRTFISAHPLLESIDYRTSGSFQFEDIPVGSFPNLRSFGGRAHHDLPVLAHAKPPLLEKITNILPGATISDLFEPLMTFKPTLRQLEFRGRIENTQLLEWLRKDFPEVKLL
jgi:hypothetical protein